MVALLKVTKSAKSLLLLIVAPPKQDHIEDTSASYMEPAVRTGRNTLLTTAAGVVGIIQQVWYVAVDVTASDSSFRRFDGTFSHFY